MDEKIEELKEVVGYDEEGEYYKKEVKIIKDKRQLSIRIPKRMADIMKINPEKDTIRFQLIPKDDEGKEFELVANLIKK